MVDFANEFLGAPAKPKIRTVEFAVLENGGELPFLEIRTYDDGTKIYRTIKSPADRVREVLLKEEEGI